MRRMGRYNLSSALAADQRQDRRSLRTHPTRRPREGHFSAGAPTTSREASTAQRSSDATPRGWPTSNRNDRDQIGIGGRLHSEITGRLHPEPALYLRFARM